MSLALVSEVSCSPAVSQASFFPLFYSKERKPRPVFSQGGQNAEAVVLKVNSTSHPHQQHLEAHVQNNSVTDSLPLNPHSAPPNPISIFGCRA